MKLVRLRHFYCMKQKLQQIVILPICGLPGIPLPLIESKEFLCNLIACNGELTAALAWQVRSLS